MPGEGRQNKLAARKVSNLVSYNSRQAYSEIHINMFEIEEHGKQEAAGQFVSLRYCQHEFEA